MKVAQVSQVVNMFFGEKLHTLSGALDALTLLWLANGCDVALALRAMDAQWPAAHVGEKVSEQLPHAHEALSVCVQVLSKAQERSPREGGWEAIDAVLLRELVPAYDSWVVGASPGEYATRGGYYDGTGTQPAVDLLRRALSAWEDGELHRPVILAGRVRAYDAASGTWRHVGGNAKPALALQAIWREILSAGVVVERNMAKADGGKDKVPQWRVADAKERKWDRLAHAGGEWTLSAVEEVSGGNEAWVRGGLHLRDSSLELRRVSAGAWCVAEAPRRARHHALFALPYGAEDVATCHAPRFEALLDNLVTGYSDERKPRVKATIKRWLALAFLGAGALGVELPLLAITGGTGTGKSTLLLLLKALLPGDGVSCVGMKSLLASDAYREQVVGKVLNLDTELSPDLLQGGDVFKQVMSSEPVSIWSMGRARYSARLTAMFATAGQNTPRFRDLDTAVLRRVVNVNVRRGVDYRTERPIAGYHELIAEEEGAGVIGACLAELARGAEEGLSLVQVVDPRESWLLEQQAEIRAESNTAVQFWAEVVQEGDEPSDRQRGSIPLALLYRAYVWWCEQTRGGGNPQSKQQFRRSLEEAGCPVFTKGKNHFFTRALLDEDVARGAAVIALLPIGRTWRDEDSEPDRAPWH